MGKPVLTTFRLHNPSTTRLSVIDPLDKSSGSEIRTSKLSASFLSKFTQSTVNMNIYLPALTGGPLSEFRSAERIHLIAELQDIYQLKDICQLRVVEVILERDDSQLVKRYLCTFLFGDNHKRWSEFISMFDGYAYLAVP